MNTVSQLWHRLSEDETLWRMLCKKRWSLKKKQDSEYATHYCYWKFQYWLYLCKVRTAHAALITALGSSGISTSAPN
jgi:hypothetical protein